MASKHVHVSIVSAAILSFITATLASQAALPHVFGAHHQEEAPSSRVQYSYAYDVRDPQSGLYSSKQESREGDVVFGNYVVEEADGSRRTVYYSADPVRGFNAEVRRQSGSSHQENADRVQPIAVPLSLPLALPVVHTYVAAPPQPTSPPPSQLQQFQFGTPIALSLAPAVLTRTSSQSEFEPPIHHTSLTSPTHSYSY